MLSYVCLNVMLRIIIFGLQFIFDLQLSAAALCGSACVRVPVRVRASASATAGVVRVSASASVRVIVSACECGL